MSVLNSHIWVSHDLYNQFPTVENARISIDESSQILVNSKLAVVVPDLLKKIGTTLTHRHWLTQKNESIIGIIEDKTLSSQPITRKKTTCPISWVAVGDNLLATEGVDNPSKEVIQIAKEVQEKAAKIISQLSFYPNQRFSNLSITVDPRISLHTDTKYFVEKNKRGKSVVTPVEKKELESTKKIVTYISMDSSEEISTETEVKNLTQQFCIQECEIDEGDGYHECYHRF